MGYTLHISRDHEDPILFEEVEKIVKEDPGFRIEDKMEAQSPSGDTITIMGTFIIWEKDGEEMYLSFRRGRINTNYTNDEDIERLKHLAVKLNARVTGDDGEEY